MRAIFSSVFAPRDEGASSQPRQSDESENTTAVTVPKRAGHTVTCHPMSWQSRRPRVCVEEETDEHQVLSRF